MPGRGRHLGPPDHLLRSALEVALGVARRRLSDEPPVPAPRGLVPFLGFARIPERALPAFRRVLDEDETLRRATRDVANEDVIGRASWLFLDRPVGWEDELDVLTGVAGDEAEEKRDRREEADVRRRLQTEAAARRRADDEVARLGREVGETKELLAAERRARRRAESDAGRLRRRSSDLAAEIEEGHRTQARLRSALDEAGASAATPAGAAVVGAMSEGAMSEGAMSEGAIGKVHLERRQPEERVDMSAVAEAVEAATSAAEALSTALAQAGRLLPPALVPPVDPTGKLPASGDRGEAFTGPRRQPVPLPPGTFDDSVAAAEHLVRVAHVRVLVDGYNVTKLARPHLPLSEQRGWLVDAAIELSARTGASLDLVFDGAGDRASAPADLGRRVGVQVRFSPEGTEADDLLLDLAAATPAGRAVVVASDDRRVREGARLLGANVITSPQLLAVVNRPL